MPLRSGSGARDAGSGISLKLTGPRRAMSEAAIFVLGAVVVGISSPGFVFSVIEVRRIHQPEE